MQRLMDRDFLTALVLLCLGGVFWSNSGDDVKDWIFPLLAAYLCLGIGVALLGHVALAAILKRAPDIADGFRDNHVIIDLLIFCAVVLVYILVMKGIGFWVASFLMLTATSLYLTLEKTRSNVLTALIVPLAFCILAYVVFIHIFYVPLPEAGWFID